MIQNNSSAFYETVRPYYIFEHLGIKYTVCRDYPHISRHRNLRQVIHAPESPKRETTLETPNPFESYIEYGYYTVPLHEENRLDLIAYKFLGSAQNAWVICAMNDIYDGFTIREGQQLKIIRNFSDLFQKHEILQSIPPSALSLGSE